jgi:UDP-glucose 4-epimerase
LSSEKSTALVTGGAGFIGSHLIDLLIDQGTSVIALDNQSTGSFHNLSQHAGSPMLKQVVGDAGDGNLITELVAKADEVYHLAAAVGVALIAKDPIGTIQNNIAPTDQILSAVTNKNRKADSSAKTAFFLASTSEVYGRNPVSQWDEEESLVFGSTTKPRWAYGVTKAIDEFLALAHHRQFNTPVVVGRFFNVVGPRQSGAYGMVLPRFVQAAIAGKPLVVHDDGAQTRCFAHVKDVVRWIVELMRNPAAQGEVVNIGSDQAVSIAELAQRVILQAESSSEITFQSYKEAYDADFEDVRFRVPVLNKLRGLISRPAEFDLKGIIKDVIRFERQR